MSEEASEESKRQPEKPKSAYIRFKEKYEEENAEHLAQLSKSNRALQLRQAWQKLDAV